MVSKTDKIKQTVKKYFPISTILLYGSRAKDNYSDDSDFDFIIIIDEEFCSKQLRKYQAVIRKELAELKIPADILIKSRPDFNVKKNIKGHILKVASEEGIEL